jgi:L-serine dehydratase
MAISVFDLFSIGIGPSSSHTVGPMRAARTFMEQVSSQGLLSKTARLKVDLYGSLALTGKGHATDLAILLGLEGETPEGVDPDKVQEKVAKIRSENKIALMGGSSISFKESSDLLFHKNKQLPYHPNGMRFTIYTDSSQELLSLVYYSVGGGFVMDHESASHDGKVIENHHTLPYSFKTAEELLSLCRKNQMTIPQLMMENEKSWRSEKELREGLLEIWKVMGQCIERGCEQEGILPGGLNVRRRAKGLYQHLLAQVSVENRNPGEVMEWISLWALAVNEENAVGGRVVTAPTNGAAGVIPAVIQYYKHFIKGSSSEGVVDFLLTAGAIGILYKENASISAAEMGCMGEVGVACSMAAGGLASALGGTNEQIENAAEIGMEHNLGLTCDPVMGLVQIPCIERNTMGAVKAINAAQLALRGDGCHRVSLDQVIAAMRETGENMKSIYKETSLGGLAVNVPEC